MSASNTASGPVPLEPGEFELTTVVAEGRAADQVAAVLSGGGVVLLDTALDDELRAEGRRVLLHCVAAHHRTPAVALSYLLGRGLDREAAVAEVHATLGREVDGGLLWKEAQHGR